MYLGSVSPASVTVAFNAVHGNQYGIFAAGPVTVVGMVKLLLRQRVALRVDAHLRRLISGDNGPPLATGGPLSRITRVPVPGT